MTNFYKQDLLNALYLLHKRAEESGLAESTGGGITDIDMAQELLLDFINNRI